MGELCSVPAETDVERLLYGEGASITFLTLCPSVPHDANLLIFVKSNPEQLHGNQQDCVNRSLNQFDTESYYQRNITQGTLQGGLSLS